MSMAGWEGATSVHLAASLHNPKSTVYISLCEGCPLEALSTHSTGLGRMTSGLGLPQLLALKGPRGQVHEKD